MEVYVLSGDKAWGLIGSSLTFFQACWKVVKENVMTRMNKISTQKEK